MMTRVISTELHGYRDMNCPVIAICGIHGGAIAFQVGILGYQ